MENESRAESESKNTRIFLPIVLYIYSPLFYKLNYFIEAFCEKIFKIQHYVYKMRCYLVNCAIFNNSSFEIFPPNV